MDDNDLERARARLADVIARLDGVIVAEGTAKKILVTGLLTAGHVLVEALPGTGKTLLCRALAAVLDSSFGRVQCTPDLLPTDVTGGDVLTSNGSVEFRKGPVFNNVLLVDEINRTGPKTQSALLQAMEEMKVTYGGNTYTLPEPFLVVATQNPVEMEGTYPLPEAQLDRFAYRVSMGGLEETQLKAILARTAGLPSGLDIEPAVGAAEVIELRRVVEKVYVPDEVMSFASRLVIACDPLRSRIPQIRDGLRFGISIRAAQAIVRGARVSALLDGRPAVGFEDIIAIARFALPHRMALTFGALGTGVQQRDLVEAVLESVAPVENV
ncbi:MAG: AAA family ATPase [Planctomycetes bacterium]|nr:AAA family ATPase [Planctomycetota bacterium]